MKTQRPQHLRHLALGWASSRLAGVGGKKAPANVWEDVL